MTKERAYEIAKEHNKLEIYTITWKELSDGRHLHIQTVYEPDYYDDNCPVVCIATEEENGDACECHTARQNDIDDIAFWIYEMCWNLEEI